MEINKEMNIDAEVNCWIYHSVKRRCLKTLYEHSMNGGFQDWYWWHTADLKFRL